MAEKLHDNWYTFVECIEGEEIATVFRVRDPEGHQVVDAVKYMDSLAATLCETADSGDVGKAARAAYQALEVEVWIGLDPNPPANAQACADEEDEDIAVDLWSPMRLAVVLQRARSLELLLQFHKEYALPALELLTAETQLPPPEETGTTTAAGSRAGAASTTGMAGTADVHQSIEELRLPRVRSGHEDAVSSSSNSQRGTHTNNNSNNNNNNGQESAPRERAGSPLPVPSPEDSATSGPRPPLRSPPENSQDPVAPTPLFHCQVRRELGNAVVLLGHYEAPVPAAHITATAAAAVVGRRSQGRTTSAAHVEELTGTPRTQPLSGPLPPPPTADEEAAAARRNRTINDLEMQVLSDAGEAYCIANVMNALKPVLDGVVQCVKEDLVTKSRPATKEDTGASTPPPSTSGNASSARFTLDTVRRHCSPFGDLLHRPVLVVEASVLFDACDEDLELLAEVLDAFQGSLTPILRGKRFCHMHGTHYAGTASGSAAPSPALHPINSVSSRGSSNIPTPRNQSLSRHGQSARHADPAAATSPHVGATAVPSPPSALHMEPFWLSCPPQDAQRLAFYALWVNHCEQLAERPGSARQRRAANALTEYRTTVSSFKRMRESNFVPASVVWSGHMFLIAKLLSRDCTIEDFLDVLGEGGYLPALSASSIPGAFVALLAAGSSAAASVTDAPTLRLLTKKIETLLAEVPNRTSTLRAFLTARPATHAERFEELWLGKTNYTTPKKFKTRVEMLYYAAVEVALVAAESAWQESEAPPPQPGSACTCTLAVSAARLVDPKRRDEARVALQGFVTAWRNFFSNARDRPFHRRSMSRSGVANFSFSGNSDVKLTPRAKPLADPQSVGPTTAPTPPGTPLPQAQPSPTPNASVTKEVIVETESLAEFNDAVRKVCTNLPMRLQHGREPLPAIYAAVYPGGALELGEAVGTGAASGEAGSSRASGAATPAHGEKALPVSSLDNEFAYVQKCFGDEAGSESNDIKLKFYGLYKQATVGDINVPKPWLMDTVGRAKWEAWNKLKGMSLVDAKRMYVNEYKMMKQMRADMGKNAK